MTTADSGVSPPPPADPARRLFGSAVLVLALLVIVVVAAVRGRIVAGEPVAQPVAAAPQVGDCVTENPNVSGVNLFNLPTLRTEPCSGVRFGEVAFIIDAFTPPPTDRDPGSDPCSEHVRAYVGTPPPPPSDGSFAPFAVVGWTMLGPGTRQRAAGQQWAGCAIYLPLFAGSGAPATVDHSLKGAWQRTADSRLFAICIDDTSSMEPAVCRSSHRFEVLGQAIGMPNIPQRTLESSCREIVVQALGSSAALDRGELGTQVLPVRTDSNGGPGITGSEAVTADSEYTNFCLATPTDSSRRLTAPLRGLGDGAVPLNRPCDEPLRSG